jgi:hypothetical protein
MVTPQARYKPSVLLQPDPGMSRREVARCLAVRFGKMNYRLKALGTNSGKRSLGLSRAIRSSLVSDDNNMTACLWGVRQ